MLQYGSWKTKISEGFKLLNIKDRVLDFVVEGEQSASVKVKSGVRQETVLGPLMFPGPLDLM